MTKEEVLQKVNDYCNEKSYTNATLTDAFKDKFADHFQKANAEADINDEAMQNAMKFALNTAFSSASELATVKASEFTSKENEYKTQIAELEKQIKGKTGIEIPKELQDQIDELKAFKETQSRQEKFASIVSLAKDGIRKDLHASFDKYAKDYSVSLEKGEKEQADELIQKFQEIFKDSIGSVKPMKPQQTQKQEEDFIASIPKVKVS